MGSSTIKYPWHFADWMEEIRYLYAILSFSLQHVARDSNFVADSLARGDASCIDFAIDV